MTQSGTAEHALVVAAVTDGHGVFHGDVQQAAQMPQTVALVGIGVGDLHAGIR